MSLKPTGLVFALATVAACSGGAAPGGNRPVPTERPTTVEVVVAPDDPAGFSYPTGTSQRFGYYRFDSLVTVHPGGQTQVQTFGRTAYLNVAVLPDSVLSDSAAADSAGAATLMRVEFRMDSISQDPRSTLRQPALDSVSGAAWNAVMAPNGGLGQVTVTRGALIGENLSGELIRLFYPAIPQQGAAIGSSWTDSSEAMIGGLTVNQRERALVSFRVPDQDADTQLVVYGEAILSRSGVEERGGQRIEAAGSGVDSTLYRFGPGGLFWGASGADSVAMTFTIPAVGQSVRVYQYGRYSLEPLPLDSLGDR